jgi:hypothetical protein
VSGGTLGDDEEPWTWSCICLVGSTLVCEIGCSESATVYGDGVRNLRRSAVEVNGRLDHEEMLARCERTQKEGMTETLEKGFKGTTALVYNRFRRVRLRDARL